MIRHNRFLLPLLIALFLVSAYMGLCLGYAKIPGAEIFRALFRPQEAPAQVAAIVTEIRLPRMLLAVIVGAGLSVAGLVMQAVVGNPIADPYILGISSGASLGATASIVLGLFSAFGTYGPGIGAFLFALLTALGVLALSGIGGRATAERLILSGLAISTAASSASTLLLYTAKNRDAVREVSFWLMGSLSGAKLAELKFLAPLILLLCLFLTGQYRNLNLMLLGDETAYSLGKDLAKIRLLYIVCVSLMVGAMVYAAGTIGFLGLIVPHMARFMAGTDHKRLILVVMLLGAIFLLWADIAARNMVPGGELPTGVVVSVVGAPFFVYLIVKNAKRRTRG